mgnify:CR=1 FL=1
MMGSRRKSSSTSPGTGPVRARSASGPASQSGLAISSSTGRPTSASMPAIHTMLPNPGFGAKKRAAETATAPSVKRNGIETESAPGPSGEIVFCADIARSSRRSSSPTGKCIKTGPADANRRLDSAMPSRSAAACANPCAAAVERSPRPAQPEPAVISSLDPAPVQTF